MHVAYRRGGYRMLNELPLGQTARLCNFSSFPVTYSDQPGEMDDDVSVSLLNVPDCEYD
jgi:hypothetical protein